MNVTDTGNNVRPAHVTTTPPKNSFAEFWSLDATTINSEILFTISCPPQSVIDLEVTCVLHDGKITNSYTTASTTLDPGIYGCALDNLNTSGTTGGQALDPVGLAQVTLS